MANTRFAYTNLVDAGTLANAPSATAANPAVNVKDGQRYILWQTASSPGTPVDVEIDLGSAQAVTLAALLNMSSLISTVNVDSASTLGVWTNRATIVPGGKVDKGAVFASQSFRYWRFRITNSGQFTVGRLWLGVVQSDMGGTFSPGTGKRTARNRHRERSPSGVQQSFYNGRHLHSWRYRFGKILNADQLLLDNVIQQQKSILLVDDGDVFYECEADDALDWSVIFTGGNGVNDVDSIAFEELF